ncbi:integrase, catalytic region, zinc finger, CCHC-type containing protein [Tanacetum coccineum]
MEGSWFKMYQRYLARGNGAAGNGGAHNRVGNANAGQDAACCRLKEWCCADEGRILFLVADECDAFNSDVDDEPTAQSIFMANLSSAEPANLQAGPFNASTLSEANVIDSATVDMGNSNVISYENYLSVNNVSAVPSCASSSLNDACVLFNNDVYVPHDPIATETLSYIKNKAEELKANTLPLPVLPSAIVYPPNTPVHLVPRTLPTTSQVNIGLYVITQLFWDFEKTCKKRITPTGITEGERGFEQTKRCYLTEVIPFFNLLKEHFDGVQKSLVTEVRAMKAVFENLEAEVDQNEIDLKSSEIERKNLLIANENLIAECLSKDVFYTATDSVLNVSRFSDMHDAFTTAQKRIADLESENFNLRNKNSQNIQSRGNTIRELKEKISRLTKKNSDADPISDLKALVSQNKDLTAKLNALHDLNERFRAKNAKVKQHYKELLIKENSKCVTISDGKPKVLAPGRYPIDVEPIPPRHKNNREVHLYYIKHLKESVETLREIVEEAKVERPLDISLASACRYTKHSQELLEHVIGTCPKDFNPRDKQNASTTLLRKKRVTFVEPCETSTHNTPAQVEHQKINSPNAPGIPSTGVKGASAASGSKPRSNTKKDSPCQLKVFVKQSPATKVWRVKQVKQVWQATGKLFTTIGHQWRPTGRLLPLGDQCPLTRNTPPKVLPTKQWKPTGRILLLERQCPLVRSTALKSGCMPADPQENVTSVAYNLACTNQPDPNCNWGSNVFKSPFSPLFKCRVYYVEGLGHNLFSVGQFCDSDLEVAFRKHTCFVRDLDGVYLIKGNRDTNLYIISIEDMMRSSPIFLLSKASKNKSWLWHRRLNHLNFGALNDLARKDLVRGLPRLNVSWVILLRSKDETPAFVINLLKQLQVGLNKTVRFVRTDNGTEFVNKDLTDYYESVGITHEKTVPRTPQQNGVVERRNRTLVEAARTMLIFSKAPLFLWAEAVATACYTQNRSLIHTLHDKTPYELVHDKKPDLSFLRVFGALCYLTNDSEDLGKLKAKADIGFFVGYASNRKGCRIYNKQTQQIMETIHVTFDELTRQTSHVHSSPGPAPNLLTPGPISSGLVPNPALTIPYVPRTTNELETLF